MGGMMRYERGCGGLDLMDDIRDRWLQSLDYTTLEKVPGSYVTDDLRHRADDVIWRVKVDQEWIYLYLLIEFQSTVDPFMAVRVLTYVGLLYQDLIRRKEGVSEKRLPPVLPIVLYNGDARWTAATDVGELIPKVPGVVGKYLPRLSYLLIEENAYPEEHIRGLKNLMAAIIRFERPESEAALMSLIEELNGWLEGNPELKRTFAIWIRAVLLRQGGRGLSLPKVRDLKELKMSLAKRFDEWALAHEQRGLEKGIAKGIERGVQRGEALLLQRQLVRRFGPLPEAVVAKIGAASPALLEVWGDRVLEAGSLGEVLGEG
jgi:hypothetical protein